MLFHSVNYNSVSKTQRQSPQGVLDVARRINVDEKGKGRRCCLWDRIYFIPCCASLLFWTRAGNLHIGFPSKSLIFCPKMSEWAIRSKKWAIHSSTHFWWATWAIRSQSLISSERCEWITHDCSFLVSNLSDSLTSLIFGEQPEQFTHIAHQTRRNAIGSFFR